MSTTYVVMSGVYTIGSYKTLEMARLIAERQPEAARIVMRASKGRIQWEIPADLPIKTTP